MKVKCRECEKEYDADSQSLCPHYTPDGRLYYVNLLFKKPKVASFKFCRTSWAFMLDVALRGRIVAITIFRDHRRPSIEFIKV